MCKLYDFFVLLVVLDLVVAGVVPFFDSTQFLQSRLARHVGLRKYLAVEGVYLFRYKPLLLVNLLLE